MEKYVVRHNFTDQRLRYKTLFDGRWAGEQDKTGQNFALQVDGFYSLLLTAKRVDTQVSWDNGTLEKEVMAKILTMAKK